MLNPWLLLFLPLVAVPVILHLITLHRLRTVELSTFRFLMDSYIQQRRRMKLLEYLVMLLRAAFVALIILTLARPEVSGFARFLGSGSGRDVSIVIDNGPSMALRSAGLAGTTSLQRAKAAARQIVEMLEPDDHVSLLTTAGGPTVLFRGYTGKAATLIQQIEAIEPQATAADLPAALAEVYGATRRGPRVVYLIGDRLRQTWDSLDGHPAAAQIDRDGRLVIMDVGPTDSVKNLAVVGEPPQDLRPVAGLPVILSVTVAGPSQDAADKPIDAVVNVVLDDQVVNRLSVSIPPGQRVTRTVAVTPTRPGVVRGRFELSHAAGSTDPFPDDDAYLFSLNVEPSVKVLLATGPAPASSQEDPGLFLGAALRAAVSGAAVSGAAVERGLAQQVQQLAMSLDVAQSTQDQLTAESLRMSDLAVLADVQMTPERGKMLRAFVESGGGLLMLPGPHTDAAAYQQHLIAGPPDQPAPLELLQPVGNPDDESQFVPVAKVQLAHPVLSVFDDPGARYFATARLYRYFPIRVDGPSGVASPLLRLANDRAVLAEMTIGRGRLLLAGFAATPQWSNLPLKPEFVPLLLRAMAHLRRPSDATVTASVRPGEPAAIHLTSAYADAQVQAINPADKPTAITMHRSGEGFVGALTHTQARGHYTFKVQPATPTAGAPIMPPLELGFAVNFEGRGADLAMLSAQRITQLLGGDRPGLAVMQSTADDPVLRQQLTRKREIWRALIWITFAVIGIEFMLATLRPHAETTAGRDRPSLLRTWRDRATAILVTERAGAPAGRQP